MSERTIYNWLHSPGGRCGRPATSDTQCRRGFRAVVQASKHLGWSAGWRKIHPALEGRVPVRLVQQCLREAKRLHRLHERKRIGRQRVHVEVLAQNVLWHEDAAHLGRTASGEVQTDVVRDAAALDAIVASVGGSVTTADAIANLEAAIEAAGDAPLVHGTDNGPPYTSGDFEDCLKGHRIVHLKNLPHTPQHNARAERLIRDVKEESGLGSGVRFAECRAADVPVAAACRRLERRASITRRDVPAPVRYTAEQRERFYEAVRRRIETAVLDAPDARAERIAEREAIHAELEERGLIRRTRGGTLLVPSKPEINS